MNTLKHPIMKRRTFLQHAGLAAGLLASAPLLANTTTSDDDDFPLVDLHVHTTD